MTDLIAALAKLEAEVRFDTITRALYSTDASVYKLTPSGVVIPRTRQALIDAVQAKEIDPDAAYLHASDKKLLQRYVTDSKLLPQVSLVGR